MILKRIDDLLEECYTNLTSILDVALKVIATTFKYRRIGIFLFSEDKNALQLRRMFYRGIILEGEEEILLSENPFLHPLISQKKDILILKKPSDYAYVSVKNSQSLFGIIRADQKDKELSREEIALFKEIAEKIANALYKNILYQDNQRQAVALRTFYETTNILVSSRYLNDILTRILESILRNFRFDLIKIYMVNRKNNVLKGIVSGNYRGTITNIENEVYPLKKGVNNLVDLVLEEPPKTTVSKHQDIVVDIPLRSKEFTVPLISKEKCLGVMSVSNILSQQKISNEEIKLLISLTDQMGMAIENAILFEEVERLSVTDSLTGLYVMRYFRERLSEEIYRSERYQGQLSVLIFDIDDFKKFNDSYGHPFGDTILKKVAELVTANIRKIDIPCRYGGDEFIIMLPQSSKEEATTIAIRLQQEINNCQIEVTPKESIKFTVSIGIAVYPEDAKTEEDLIKKADQALYYAKSHGKNQIRLSSEINF